MWSELKESVTALLLSCDLALAVPNVPGPAADKRRLMHELACQIRERREATVCTCLPGTAASMSGNA